MTNCWIKSEPRAIFSSSQILLKSRITSSNFLSSWINWQWHYTEKNLWFTPLLGGPLRMKYVLWPKCIYALVVFFFGVPPSLFWEKRKHFKYHYYIIKLRKKYTPDPNISSSPQDLAYIRQISPLFLKIRVMRGVIISALWIVN